MSSTVPANMTPQEIETNLDQLASERRQIRKLMEEVESDEDFIEFEFGSKQKVIANYKKEIGYICGEMFQLQVQYVKLVGHAYKFSDRPAQL